jgi:hypothetical protein
VGGSLEGSALQTSPERQSLGPARRLVVSWEDSYGEARQKSPEREGFAARTAQEPYQSGRRFSRKARTPSCPSAPTRACAIASTT